MNKLRALILSAILTALIALALNFGSANDNWEEDQILRVIDGDTIELVSGKTIRLANINTPEKNKPGYLEAKKFLASYENSSVLIQVIESDRYDRLVGRVKTQEGDYLNLKLVELGLAKKFMVHEEEIKKFNLAEENAVSFYRGQWIASEHSDCLSISIHPKEELLIIFSNCSLSNLIISDESRKEYNLAKIEKKITLHSGEGNDNSTDIFWNAENVWNNDRDTVYIQESSGNLLHHLSYGY